jgi:hypothetical protein
VLTIDYCGILHQVPDDRPWTIGRVGDLALDQDNQFLHRHFLRITRSNDYWWLANVGSRMSANLADTASRAHTWLAPGASVPIAFEEMQLLFTAGPTTYELLVTLTDAPFSAWAPAADPTGITTVGLPVLTASQHLLIVALAEPALRRQGQGAIQVPASAAAADRLGWTQTRFNRKLDNVCDRLTKHGVRGLHGDQARLASDRRARLVEFALSVGLVTPEHLALLHRP